MARGQARTLGHANENLALELPLARVWLELRLVLRQDERVVVAALGQLTRCMSSTRTDEIAAARMSADVEGHSNCAASRQGAQHLVRLSSTSPRTISHKVAFLEG